MSSRGEETGEGELKTDSIFYLIVDNSFRDKYQAPTPKNSSFILLNSSFYLGVVTN
jgi:hypothetical protein